MPYNAWFRCYAGCDERHALNEVVYNCSTCGGLLEVVHDVEALRDRSAAAWVKLFDERYMRTCYPYGSGVWGKKEWVVPTIDDANVVSLFEGGTNLFASASSSACPTSGSSSAATATPGRSRTSG